MTVKKVVEVWRNEGDPKLMRVGIAAGHPGFAMKDHWPKRCMSSDTRSRETIILITLCLARNVASGGVERGSGDL